MERPRVLVDATSLPPTRGGVARYLAGLLVGLGEIEAPVLVVVKPEDLAWLSGQAPRHDYVTSPPWLTSRPLRLVWEQWGLPRLARRHGVDVIHSPHYTFALAAARRTVVTVHDGTFFSAPEDHGRIKGLFFRTWIALGRRLAARSIAPSDATSRELAQYARPARGPVDVAHHGVDPVVFRPPSDESVLAFAARLGLDPRVGWIAFLGTVEPRKNVGPLIAAHEAMTQRDATTPPLLVAGGLGWDLEASRRLEEAGDVVGGTLRYLGYLPLDDLSPFLGGASLVVYPSSAEGFGLPVLEAMSTGALVLTTDRTALPEVGGDAVLYAEPAEGSLTTAMTEALTDRDGGAALRGRAVGRAKLFTWAACAVVHHAAYRAVSDGAASGENGRERE